MPRLIVLLMLLLLGGCTTSLAQLQKIEPNGSSFQIYLAREYLDFAEAEADQYDWSDSSHFARKGLKAAKGLDVAPENIADRDLPEDSQEILTQARESLMQTFDAGAITKDPKQAARAQFMFDCWVEQEEESWQVDHIAYCRENFYSTLDKLFNLTSPDVDLSPEEPVEDEVRLQEKESKPYIYFDSGSSKLNEAAKKAVSDIIAELKDSKGFTITLNGYADKVGSSDANMQISKKRAQAVKKAFTDSGFDEKSITIFAFGEIQGGAGKKPDQQGRMVEVVVEK